MLKANAAVELLTAHNLRMHSTKSSGGVLYILRYLPGVTVFGYPAGRKTAEIACCKACQGFSLSRRLRRARDVFVG